MMVKILGLYVLCILSRTLSEATSTPSYDVLWPFNSGERGEATDGTTSITHPSDSTKLTSYNKFSTTTNVKILTSTQSGPSAIIYTTGKVVSVIGQLGTSASNFDSLQFSHVAKGFFSLLAPISSIMDAIKEAQTLANGGSAELLAVRELRSTVEARFVGIQQRLREVEAGSEASGIRATRFENVQTKIKHFYNCLKYTDGFVYGTVFQCCRKFPPADVASDFETLLVSCVMPRHYRAEISNASVDSSHLSDKPSTLPPVLAQCTYDQKESFENIFSVLRPFYKSETEAELMSKLKFIAEDVFLKECRRTRLCGHHAVIRRLQTIVKKFGLNRRARQDHRSCLLNVVAEIAWGRRDEFTAYNNEFIEDFANIAVMAQICNATVNPDNNVDLVKDVEGQITAAITKSIRYSNNSLNSFWEYGMRSRLIEAASLYTGLEIDSQNIAEQMFRRMKEFGPATDQLLVVVAPASYKCAQNCRPTECLFYVDELSRRIFYLVRKRGEKAVARNHGVSLSGLGTNMCYQWNAGTFPATRSTIVLHSDASYISESSCKFSIGYAGTIDAIRHEASSKTSNLWTLDVCTFNSLIIV